jgi:hypothetical protein
MPPPPQLRPGQSHWVDGPGRHVLVGGRRPTDWLGVGTPTGRGGGGCVALARMIFVVQQRDRLRDDQCGSGYVLG